MTGRRRPVVMSRERAGLAALRRVVHQIAQSRAGHPISARPAEQLPTTRAA